MSGMLDALATTYNRPKCKIQKKSKKPKNEGKAVHGMLKRNNVNSFTVPQKGKIFKYLQNKGLSDFNSLEINKLKRMGLI